MGSVWQRMIGDKRGIALIFTVFVVIGVSMVLANSFLKGTRQERTIGRAIKRSQERGVQRFMADRGFRLLKQYVEATGQFPGGALNEEITAQTAAAGMTSGQRFYEKLNTDYTDWKTRMTTGATPPRAIPWLGRMTVNTVSGGAAQVNFIYNRQISATSREYLLSFAVNHSDTGAQERIAQRIVVTLGGASSIFDYSVFYNGDLEIQAARDWELYGPIYATGDVYLTTANAATFTIRAPQDDWSEPYALESYRRIYFGPKRVVGDNYLQECYSGACGCSMLTYDTQNRYNPKYCLAIRQEVRVDDYPRIQHIDSGTRFCSMPELNPEYWLRDQKAFGVWALGPNDAKHLWNSPPCQAIPLAPYFYYFLSEIWYDDTTTHTIRIADQDGGQLHDFEAPAREYYPSWTAEDFSQGKYVNISRSYYTPATNYTGEMSISSAFNPNDDPTSYHGSTYTRYADVYDSHNNAITNPNWVGYEDLNGIKLFWDNAPRTGGVPLKNVLSGIAAGNPHMIIEPIDSVNDSPEVQAAKLQSQTNIRFLCNDTACTTRKWETWKKDASGNFTPFESGSGMPPGLPTYSMFIKDPRLGLINSGRPFVLNVGDIMTYAAAKQLTTDNTLSVYVQMNPGGEFGRDKAVMYVTNAATLPQNGFALVSNGRVWVTGNFNVYDYAQGQNCTNEQLDYDVWAEGSDVTCTVPPAAIYSDCFGFQTTTSNFYPQAATDSYLNAAIITGSLSSRLIPAYPLCWGGDFGGGPVDFSGCMYEDSRYPRPEVQQKFRARSGHGVVNANGQPWWRPIKSYADASGSMGDFDCPGGLDPATGQPLDSLNCEYWLENTTGIYYYNNRPGTGRPDGYKGRNTPDNWDIPLFGAAETPYTMVNTAIPAEAGKEYAAKLLRWERNMWNGSPYASPPYDFPFEQVPDSTVYPGMSPAWTLSRYFFPQPLSLWTGTYPRGGSTLVSVGADPETELLKINPYNGATEASQLGGLVYQPDFGYMPLWVPMYSGGLENLIDLKEHWAGKTLHFRGCLVRLWDSTVLEDLGAYWGLGGDRRGFYGTNGTSRTKYYTAPNRDYRFDPSLRTRPPPVTPEGSGGIRVQLSDRDF